MDSNRHKRRLPMFIHPFYPPQKEDDAANQQRLRRLCSRIVRGDVSVPPDEVHLCKNLQLRQDILAGVLSDRRDSRGTVLPFLQRFNLLGFKIDHGIGIC